MFDGIRPNVTQSAPPGEPPGVTNGMSTYPMGMDEEDTFSIGEYIAILLEHKWLIILITTLSVLIGAAYASISKPIYRTDSLLQVEEEAAGISALDALQTMGEQTSSVNAEIEILRSRMILGQVVEKLQLDTIAVPSYFQLVGEPIARRYSGGGVAKPWFGQDEYAWGGEAIKIERLEVPGWLRNTPLTLIAGQAGEFSVSDDTSGWQIQGKVGERIEAALPGGDQITLFVSSLKARPGTRFSLLRRSLSKAVADLSERLSVSERSRGSGIVEMRLTGTERSALPSILDEVMHVFVRQNVERHSAEAEHTLRFLETQLPALKEQLDAAEDAYNSYRLEEGSVDLTSETQSVLALVIQVDNQLVGLQQEREGLRQRFKSNHPTIQSVDRKISRLQRKRKKLDTQVTELPGTQQIILRLKRDVAVNTRLYTELLNTAQQLRVAKAGTIGNVRIIDRAALDAQTIAPRKGRIMAISVVLGLLASLLIIWVIRNLRVMVEDPEAIERNLGLPVYATIPYSKFEEKLSKLVKRGKANLGLLAMQNSEDDAIESLRSLRTSLRFAMAESGKGGLLITGASQGVGKSFVSKNLALLLAQAGESVVIVDADMRRGHLHREFGLPRELGLSEYLSQKHSIDSLIKATILEGLDIITTGERPPNSSELLMQPRFEALIQRLTGTYEHVIVDAPPILAVSDAAMIGRHVGTTLLIARAGQHTLHELDQSIKRLALSGVTSNGFVLNGVDTMRLRYRYGYGYGKYHYQYKYK